MSLRKLSRIQINEIIDCLGPDYFHFRSTSVFAREMSNAVDLYFEILRWHCVNSACLSDHLKCFEALGRIPLRCSGCGARVKGRQMFRYKRRVPEHPLYICCLCVLREARLFLVGVPDCLICRGIVQHSRNDRAAFLVTVLSRAQNPRGGFVADCLASMKPLVRIECKIA